MASFYSKNAETETRMNPCHTWVRHGTENQVNFHDVEIVDVECHQVVDLPTRWVQIEMADGDKITMFIPDGQSAKEFCEILADHFARVAKLVDAVID